MLLLRRNASDVLPVFRAGRPVADPARDVPPRRVVSPFAVGGGVLAVIAAAGRRTGDARRPSDTGGGDRRGGAARRLAPDATAAQSGAGVFARQPPASALALPGRGA